MKGLHLCDGLYIKGCNKTVKPNCVTILVSVMERNLSWKLVRRYRDFFVICILHLGWQFFPAGIDEEIMY